MKTWTHQFFIKLILIFYRCMHSAIAQRVYRTYFEIIFRIGMIEARAFNEKRFDFDSFAREIGKKAWI